MPFISSVRHHATNLTNFAGRETRAQFWPYAIAVFMLITIICMSLFLPPFFQSMERFERFAEQHPDSATVKVGSGQRTIRVEGDHPELMPDMGPFLVAVILSGIGTVALLAAAVVRRLHDLGRSGRWGALPLPFLALALTVEPAAIARRGDIEMGLSLLLFFNNLVYLGCVARLFVWLARAGDASENRFGTRPVA